MHPGRVPAWRVPGGFLPDLLPAAAIFLAAMALGVIAMASAGVLAAGTMAMPAAAR
jgi:hypothetical protein